MQVNRASKGWLTAASARKRHTPAACAVVAAAAKLLLRLPAGSLPLFDVGDCC
jgi:hypothetical protein